MADEQTEKVPDVPTFTSKTAVGKVDGNGLRIIAKKLGLKPEHDTKPWFVHEICVAQGLDSEPPPKKTQPAQSDLQLWRASKSAPGSATPSDFLKLDPSEQNRWHDAEVEDRLRFQRETAARKKERSRQRSKDNSKKRKRQRVVRKFVTKQSPALKELKTTVEGISVLLDEVINATAESRPRLEELLKIQSEQVTEQLRVVKEKFLAREKKWSSAIDGHNAKLADFRKFMSELDGLKTEIAAMNPKSEIKNLAKISRNHETRLQQVEQDHEARLQQVEQDSVDSARRLKRVIDQLWHGKGNVWDRMIGHVWG